MHLTILYRCRRLAQINTRIDDRGRAVCTFRTHLKMVRNLVLIFGRLHGRLTLLLALSG